MRLTIVGPDGGEVTMTFDPAQPVYAAAGSAAAALGLCQGAWGLGRGSRSLASVLGLADAGIKEGETLELRPL